jgi:hypothetical protein
LRVCKSGYRFREAGRKFSSTGYKRIAISEFHDFCEIFTVGEKIAAASGPPQVTAHRATWLELTMRGEIG